MVFLPQEGHLAVSHQLRSEDGRFSGFLHDDAESPLVSDDHRKNLTQFLHALRALDVELESLNIPEPIRVRATGGFALLAHGLREDGFTVDIDTITESYDTSVRDAINRVAADLHLEQDWINNQATGDSVEETMNALDAVFIASDYGFGNIDLSIADVPTLTRAKAIVVDVDAMSGRTRDWGDLVRLMNHQKITSHREFCNAYPSIPEWEYPETHRSIKNWFETGERGEAAPEEDFDFEWDDADYEGIE